MNTRPTSQKIVPSPKEQHCEQCGSRIGIDAGEWEGYTSCCNELICWGDGCVMVLSEYPAGPAWPGATVINPPYRTLEHYRDREDAEEMMKEAAEA